MSNTFFKSGFEMSVINKHFLLEEHQEEQDLINEFENEYKELVECEEY